MGLNVVALMGRLVAEPELRHTTSGVATCTFRIAVDRSYSKDGERKADFIDIVTWRQTAEFVCKYFHKGSKKPGKDIPGNSQCHGRAVGRRYTGGLTWRFTRKPQ